MILGLAKKRFNSRIMASEFYQVLDCKIESYPKIDTFAYLPKPDSHVVEDRVDSASISRIANGPPGVGLARFLVA